MNSKIIEILSLYSWDIAIVLVAILTFFALKTYLLRTGNYAKAKSIILQLVVEAEKYLGSKTGEIKKQQVIAWLYTRYPFMSFIIPRDTMNILIEDQVRQLKLLLSTKDANLNTLTQETDISLIKDANKKE